MALGLVTKNELRGPRFVRVFPDIYLHAGLRLDFATRSEAAFLLVSDRGGVLCGYSAATLLGADCVSRGAPAEVLVDHDVRPHPGLRVARGRAGPDEVLAAGRCRVTTPLRTAWDLARRLDLVEAVVAVDAVARVGGFVPADLILRRTLRPGARGCRRLDRVVALADPRAESPMETRLRLLLVTSGLPRPAVQHRLLDEHGFVVARFDLAYPDALLAIEYDGDGHRTRVLTNDDRWRDATTADHGWHTLRFSYDDVVLTRRRTVELVRGMLARRRRLLRGI